MEGPEVVKAASKKKVADDAEPTELDLALSDLQDLLDVRLDISGHGHPADVDVVGEKGEYIVIADVSDEGEPLLEVLSTEKYLELWWEARTLYEAEGHGHIVEVLWEEGYPEVCLAMTRNRSRKSGQRS
jgi:hypothetical protein